jgi:hypothetical protein
MSDVPSAEETPEHVLRVTPSPEWRRVARSAAQEVDVAQRLVASPAFRQMLESAAQAQRALRSSVIQTLVDSYSHLWEQLRPGIEVAFRAMADALPPNWADVDLGAAVDLAEQGWPIVWVPRSDVVAELVAASTDDERDAILVAEAATVVEDVLTALTAVAGPGESAIADALREAAASALDGRWIACQATTAVTLDTLVGAETLIKRHLATIAERYSADDVALYEMRLALILRAVPPAFAEFRVHRGDAVPSRFNRHATVHRVSYDQLTKLNALTGLLIATSLTCELAAHGSREVIVHDVVIRPGLDVTSSD